MVIEDHAEFELKLIDSLESYPPRDEGIAGGRDVSYREYHQDVAFP